MKSAPNKTYDTFSQLVEEELPSRLKKAVEARAETFPYKHELLIALVGVFVLLFCGLLFAWLILH